MTGRLCSTSIDDRGKAQKPKNIRGTRIWKRQRNGFTSRVSRRNTTSTTPWFTTSDLQNYRRRHLYEVSVNCYLTTLRDDIGQFKPQHLVVQHQRFLTLAMLGWHLSLWSEISCFWKFWQQCAAWVENGWEFCWVNVLFLREQELVIGETFSFFSLLFQSYLYPSERPNWKNYGHTVWMRRQTGEKTTCEQNQSKYLSILAVCCI